MGNETIAEKESDAWMMRLAKTMGRVAERVGWYYILREVVTDFSTRIGVDLNRCMDLRAMRRRSFVVSCSSGARPDGQRQRSHVAENGQVGPLYAAY